MHTDKDFVCRVSDSRGQIPRSHTLYPVCPGRVRSPGPPQDMPLKKVTLPSSKSTGAGGNSRRELRKIP